MKKILVTGLSSNIGGIETFYMSYYRLLKKKNYMFDFIVIDDSIAFEEEILRNNDNVYKLPSFKKNPLKYSKMLNEIMKKNKYGVLHANMLSAANILPLKLAKKNGIKKIIAHSHNGGVPSGFVRKILNNYNKKNVFKYANIFLACSDLAGKWFFGHEANYIIIKNAIDLEKFSFSEIKRKKIRDEYNLNSEIVIGHIGKICEQKNHIFLVKAFNELCKKEKDCKLMLLGNGENEELSQYLNNSQIIKLPAHKNIDEYYSAFDIFVLPSLFEGLPVVGIEAQANGLPCLFADTITKELNINDNCEFINLNIEKWVEILENLIRNKKIKRTSNILLKENGYSIKDACEKLEKIYGD